MPRAIMALGNAYDVVRTASKLVNQPFTGSIRRDAKYFGRFKHLSLPVSGEHFTVAYSGM